ncbi:hypothetical protein D6829_01080 [Candidatus Pacearchaeota archaeon]|nr:MAG: hypothetical protein D6829_01080 [Candidatus Pacearchaeota archaeon]
MRKKGAIELSIGTIVIVVLAMSMLILGLILVKSIFSGSSQNIKQINQGVRDKINKLMGEDKKVAVYLQGQEATISPGESYGVAFGIKNRLRGSAGQNAKFSYKVSVVNPDKLEKRCGIDESEALGWIVAGDSEDEIKISPSELTTRLIKFNIDENTPLCTVRFRISVEADNKPYADEIFDLRIE